MTIVTNWCYVATTLCVILFWLIFLHTTDNYAPMALKDMEQSQHHILSSKPTSQVKLRDTLVDLDNFEFVMNNASLCTDSTTIQNHSAIVILIHTARYHFDRRYAIRSTWGSVKMFRQWHLRLVFLLGSHPNSATVSIESKLWDESKQFGDMVMGNFVDSYRNLTYKHLMGYKWVSTFCPMAKYILKTDDDIYADIFHIIDVILMELENSQKTYACENMFGNAPDRRTMSKWYVPKEDFPDDMYPAFCSGSAYLMRAEDASKIYSISNRTNFLWVDDVFVTGVLREKYDKIVNTGGNSSLQILNLQKRYHLGEKNEIIDWCSKDLSTGQLLYAFILLDNDDFIRDMFCIWNKVRLMRFAMNLGLV